MIIGMWFLTCYDGKVERQGFSSAIHINGYILCGTIDEGRSEGGGRYGGSIEVVILNRAKFSTDEKPAATLDQVKTIMPTTR
jgi:hypothetical protein